MAPPLALTPLVLTSAVSAAVAVVINALIAVVQDGAEAAGRTLGYALAVAAAAIGAYLAWRS